MQNTENKNRPFDNIVVLDPNGNFMSYTSKKRMKYLLRKKNATVVVDEKGNTVIKLSHTPEVQNFDQPVFRENKCELCGAKTRLTRHHVYPRWHKKIKEMRSDNLRCNCEPCHKKIEEYYKWRLHPVTQWDRALDEVENIIATIRRVIKNANGEDKSYGYGIIKNLIKKKEILKQKQDLDRQAIIDVYDFKEIYKEAVVYAKLKRDGKDGK